MTRGSAASARRGTAAAAAAARAGARPRRGSRSECAPTTGSSGALASPACMTSAPPVKIVRTSSGSPRKTMPSPSKLSVKMSPKRSRWRAAELAWAHDPLDRLGGRGGRGPGGRSSRSGIGGILSASDPAVSATRTALRRYPPAPMAAPSSPDAIRDVNTRYHDGAAADYDAKWGIDWGQTGREQVLGKLRKALGGALPVFDRSLEIGAGTGLLLPAPADVRRRRRRDVHRHLPRDGRRAARNAERLDLEVDALVADAERLPFDGRRASTSSSGTRCCTTCPTSSRPSPSSSAC